MAPENTENPILRPAVGTDADALVALLRETFRSTWQPVLTPAAVASYLARDPARGFIEASIPKIVVAEDTGGIRGMIHWEADFVTALHVADDARRRGIGRRLLGCAEAAIAAAGHRQARLETDTFNTRAIAFYTALGYRESARYPDEEWDSGLTTLLMEKSLRD